MATLTTEQYGRWKKAMKAGDMDLVAEIENEGYAGKAVEPIEVEVIDDYILPTPDDIKAYLAEGKTKKDVAEDYGISIQKVTAIAKKG